MNDFDRPSDEPRRALLTVATCLLVLILGLMLCCVGRADGTEPKSPGAGVQLPSQHVESLFACVTGEALEARQPALTSTKLTCPTRGRCDRPSNRDLAIPDEETPIKYLTVRYQSLANGDGSEPLFSRADAAAATQWLNFCYQPWRIQFVFDHRMIYSFRFHEIHGGWPVVDELGREYSFDIRRYMNIFTTNNWCEWQSQYTLCGGALGPWQYSSTGPPWTVLMTRNHWAAEGLICHEVGHNFGLIHTFGDFDVAPCSACDEVVGAGNGDTSGDFCSDTPPTPEDPWNTRCAPAIGTDQCSGLPWGETDYRNWMAYTPYAPCKDHFTAQQAGRMHCWLEDTRSEWISYAAIEPDADFGPAPLEVRFEGVTSMRANDWQWAFGDGGTGEGQQPIHIYAAPGIFSPTVTIDTAEGEFEAAMPREIWVHQGSISIANVEQTPGGSEVIVPVTITNSVPVDFVDLPLQWSGSDGLALDSVTTRGFPAAQWIERDPVNRRGCLRVWTVDDLALAPGEHHLANLFFTLDPSTSFASTSIRLEEYGECRALFVTDRGAFQPEAVNGSLLICEGATCAWADPVRRPFGRRQP